MSPAPESIEPEWWASNLPRVRAYVRRRLRPELAQIESPTDIVQSACRELLDDIRLESSLNGGIGVLRFRFLRRAMRKVVQKHRYHAARRRSPALPLLPLDNACDSASGPLERALRNERAAQLAAAMQQLSVPQQRIIEWIHFEELGHAEVAARLGCTVDASKMRLCRALAELSRHLDGA